MKTVTLSRPAVQGAATLFMFVLCIAPYCIVCAQAQLVKDLNTTPYRYFNEYTQFTNAGTHFYFVNNGKELWKSDGTRSGTRRLKTIQKIEHLTFVGNMLYFAGTDGSGSELWKSDGTSSGTVRLKDIRKGLTGSSPNSFISLNGRVFFVANNGNGTELWKTNGTSSGTVLVKDIWEGSFGSCPSYLTRVNNMLYFSADDGIHGRELWKTDGTAVGTIMVKDIQSLPGDSSNPRELVGMNGFVFFSAHYSSSGDEIWRSDGTAKGTVRLKDINPGEASSDISSIKRMGNALYFHAHDGSTGTALWRSSGTTAGTVMIKTLTNDASRWEVFDMTVLNNRIYWIFRGNVWVSNGTAAGTKIAAFTERAMPARFTWMNNRVYYLTRDWSEDPYGPLHRVNSINPDGSDWQEIFRMFAPFTVGGEEDEFWYDYSLELLAFDNSLFFPGIRNEIDDYKLLKSDGTKGGTTVFMDTYKPTHGSFPNTMVRHNSEIFFATNDQEWDNLHLWRTDGTKTGTIKLASNTAIANITSTVNGMFFTTDGWELWKTDGSVAGTTMLKRDDNLDLNFVTKIITSGNRLFFQTNRGSFWTSDGSRSGTILLKQFPYIEHIGLLGNNAYVIAGTSAGGQEVWKSNGTLAGTAKIKTIRSAAGPDITDLTSAIGNVSYFVAHDGIHGHELWRTDGTTAGTFMVKDIRPGENENRISDILRLVAHNNLLYINALDVNGELALFISDGTNTGTRKISDSNRILEFIPNKDDQLLFVSSGPSGFELWSTNGTTAGTTLLKTLPGSNTFEISSVEINGIVYLAYENGMKIWRTDGTICGTFGIDVGLTNMNNLSSIESNLLFSAKNRLYGNELFAFNVNNVSAPACPEASGARNGTMEGDMKDGIYSPNPFSHELALMLKSDHPSIAEVTVFDMAGQPVMSENLETNKTHQIGHDWNEGFYVMRIVLNGRITNVRLLKARP